MPRCRAGTGLRRTVRPRGVRGPPALMHNQHNSAIPVEYRKLRDGELIPLFTVFLMSDHRPDTEDLCRYSLRLRLQPVNLRDGVQQFERHMEQVGSWEGVLDVETIQTADRGWTLRWLWRYQSTVEWQEATPKGSNPTVEVPFPASAAEELGPNAVLRMTATPWNDWNVG